MISTASEVSKLKRNSIAYLTLRHFENRDCLTRAGEEVPPAQEISRIQ